MKELIFGCVAWKSPLWKNRKYINRNDNNNNNNNNKDDVTNNNNDNRK